MDNLSDELISAFEAGTLLQSIYSHYVAEKGENTKLPDVLSKLHNDGAIDIVAAFSTLRNGNNAGVDFFLTRYVFEQTLPLLIAPVEPVMVCVNRLYTEAGHDMAAGSIFDGYITFCMKDPSRPQEALKVIEANPKFENLLPPTLIGGSRIDPAFYFATTIQLAGHQDIQTRRRALFALGRIDWPAGATAPDSAIAALEKIVADESDDELLACAIKTSFSAVQRDRSQEDRVIKLIETALTKGSDTALHAASQNFAVDTADLSERMVGALFSALLRTATNNKGTIDNIDRGLERLLQTDLAPRALGFLETFLIDHDDDISLEAFDSVVMLLRKNKALREKVATRWLLSGQAVLCEGVDKVVGMRGGPELELDVDASELIPADGMHIIFLARKAAGYLFFHAVSAASLIVSLMHHTSDENALLELGNILIDPLMLNFTGKARRYITEREAGESGAVKEMLGHAIKGIDDYLDELKTIGEIPELYPSEAQREAYNRRFARQMAESFKEAEKRSVFLSIMQKRVLLYGRESIDYVHGPDGQSKRIETPLKGHSVEIEMPRKLQLDPFGLEYTLRVFRVEQFRT